MVGVELQGFKTLSEDLMAMAKILADYNEKATIQNLIDFKSKSVQMAPYKTGTLRRSIAYTILYKSPQQGIVIGTIGSDLPYARITELGGTIPSHTIVPKNAKVLAVKGGPRPNAQGFTVFGTSVTIPAQYRKAQPYLMPVLILNIDRFLKRYGMAFDMAVQEIRSKSKPE